MKSYALKYSMAIMLMILAIIVGTMLLIACDDVRLAYAESEDGTTLEDYFANDYMQNADFDRDALQITISGNDSIIDLIPSDFFTEEGQHLFIGDDYGCYVYTFEDRYYDTPSSESNFSGNNRSIVLGFSIEYFVNGNVEQAQDGFSFTIEQIFQREYVTLLPGGENSIAIGDYDRWEAQSTHFDAFCMSIYLYEMDCVLGEDVSKGDGLVFPVPQYHFAEDNFAFDDVDLFFLKDIVVSAMISNEQDCNYGESGYSVQDDNGCFLIGTGFELAGTRYFHESTDWGGIACYTADAVISKLASTVIGTLPGGALINGALDVMNFLLGTGEYFGGDYFEAVEGDSYYGTVDIPNSKYAQINTSGKLYRGATVRTQDTSGESVWFGRGDHFTAVFEVGSGAGNDPSWRTVVQHAVSVSVDSLFVNLEETTASSAFYANTLNNLRDKQLCEDETQEAYVMAPIEGAVEGKDFFVFTPDEAGFYTLDVSGSGVNVDVKDENEASLTASGLGYFLEEGENYYITLINTTTSLQRPSITVSATELAADYQDSYVFTVPANTSVTVGVDLVNMFTNVEVAGVGVTITCLSTTDNVWVEYANATSIDVDRQKVERIEISNTSASPQNCTITFSAPPQLSTDGAQTVTISDRISYFRFVPQAEAYVFEWCDVPEGATINFTIYGTDDAYANVSMRQDSVFVTGLTEGQTYWIGLYDAVATAEEEIELAVDEQTGISIKWCIDDVVVETNSVTLYNGRSYDVAICINDQKYYFPYEYRLTTTKEHITFTENGLTVSFQENDNIISMESSLVYSIPEDVWICFSGERVVMIDLEICLVDAVNKVIGEGSLQLVDAHNYDGFERVTAKVTDSKITSLHYLVRYQDWKFDWQELTGEAEVVTGSDGTFQFDFDFNETTAYETSVKITHIDYDGYCFAFPDTKYPSIDFPVTIGGGDGTAEDPFLLMCERHYLTFIAQISYFEALGEADDMHWLMMDDIDISDLGSYEIDVFRGNFDGGGHTLSGLTIEIPATAYTSDKNFGWVNTNYGTIKNVTFSDVVITAPVCHSGAWVNVGAVVGVNEAGAVIDDVSISNVDIDVNRNMSCIGGVAGVNKGTISNCFADGGSEHPVLLFGNGDMGIFCGKNSGQVESCNANLVSLEHYPSVANRSIGGVVGYCESGEIKDCYILLCMISVTGTDAGICPNIGGIAGHVANANMLVNNTNACLMDLEALTDAQKVNCCEDGSRDYGCVG